MAGKILVLNVSGIGDFIDSTPALAALRRRRPFDRVVLAVAEKTLPLARSCPHVDEVIGLPTRPGRGIPSLVDLPRWAFTVLSWRKRFDIVLSLYGASSPRGRRFTRWLLSWIGAPVSLGKNGSSRPGEELPLDLMSSYRKLVSLVPRDPEGGLDRDELVSPRARPELWIPEEAFRDVDRWLAQQVQLEGLQGPYVLVALGGDRPSRRESPPRAERWLGSIQDEFRVRPILFGAPDDPGLPEGSRLAHADARGRWDLTRSAALVSRADVVITTQSVAQHLVSVWDVPTVVLAGPGDPRKHRPHLSKSLMHLVRHEVACAPCYHHDCPLSGGEYQKCLAGIAPEEVLEAFRELMEPVRNGGPRPARELPRADGAGDGF